MSADLFRCLVDDHRERLRARPAVHAVLRHLARCGTAAAGTHTLHCLACDHQVTIFNSCGNRHCPSCQAGQRRAWVQSQIQDILPIPYFHVVCTMPHDLLPLVRAAPAAMYHLLMQSSQQALASLCGDPRHLGATIGQIQVLHTWGSNLGLHPHVHTIVSGGGFRPDGHFIRCHHRGSKKRPFLVPVAALRKRFLGLMIAGLWKLYHASIFADCRETIGATFSKWKAFLQVVGAKKWVVYAKRPFGGPDQVIKYLGRYTHRVAISPGRLSHYDGHSVTLRWTDYAHHGRKRHLRLSAIDLLRRFTEHILPPHFRRLRLCGFLAPRVRAVRLAEARAQLGPTPEMPAVKPFYSPATTSSSEDTLTPSEAGGPRLCPCCHQPCLYVAIIRRPVHGGGLNILVPKAYRFARDRLRENLSA